MTSNSGVSVLPGTYGNNMSTGGEGNESSKPKIDIGYQGVNLMPTKESLKSLGAQGNVLGHVRRNAIIMIVSYIYKMVHS